MGRINVVKVWYQNDWGRYARRDERLTRALLEDSRVGRVVHLEPPVPADLAQRADVEQLDPGGFTRRRVQVLRENRLTLFTPALEAGQGLAHALQAVEELLVGEGVFDSPALLWVSAPGVLGDGILQSLAGRFQWILAEIEDDHRHYAVPGSEAALLLQRRYERAVRGSDVLVSNSQSMVDEFAVLQPVARRIQNAVDLDEYTAERPCPSVLSGCPGPCLTYVGSLQVRLRTDLLLAVAQELPEATLLLFGAGAEALPPALRAQSNVICPGPVSAAEVPALLRHSDALLLPHEVSPQTESMDPQKLYEYLASGTPVVATPVAGARDFGDVVELAETGPDLVAAIRRALVSGDPDGRRRRQARVAGRSWKQAAREVLDLTLAAQSPGARWRQESELAYFDHDRPEVRELVPAVARRILDLGCGAGALGQGLQRTRDCEVTGVELHPAAAERARERLQEVRCGDVMQELATFPRQSFDAVICADLLEHLADPARLLREVTRVLRPTGRFVLSLPNAGHWSVVRQLLEGEFEYVDAGILDRTHLRFFTRRSAQRLLAENNLHVEEVRGVRWYQDGMPEPVFAALRELGVVAPDAREESGHHQILLTARPVAAPAAPRRLASSALDRAAEVSVVIPVCNAPDYTRWCLEDLRTYVSAETTEVIVVDNGSDAETQAVLAAFPEVCVLRNETNRGFAAAVNQGLEAARAPIVCVLNSDTRLTTGWLAPLVETLRADPRVALAGPCTSYANGRQQVDIGAMTTPDEMRAAAAAWVIRHRHEREDVAFLSGFCFVGRREELVGERGLAEVYGIGTFEDTELSRRLRRQGRRLVVARDAYVYHFGNRTFQALGIDVMAQQQVNQQRFLDRHQQDPIFAAQEAARNGAWERVIRLCWAALKASAVDLDALRLAAEALDALGRTAEAARLWQRLAVALPADPEVVRRQQAEGISESFSRPAERASGTTSMAF